MTGPDVSERKRKSSELRVPKRGSTAADNANRWSEFANSRPQPDILRHFYEEAKREAEERKGQADR